MEQYIVIAKPVAGAKGKFEDHQIIKADVTIPQGYEKVAGPTSLEDCVKILKEATGNQPNWFGLTLLQYLLIGIVTLTFVAVVVIGALKLQGLEPNKAVNLITTADDSARIFITFVIAVATVAIAFLAILTAMMLREYKERFILAKEVLTILVGILGTIVGFYFGTANNPASDRIANVNSNVNANVNSNPAGAPAATATPTASIIRRGSGEYALTVRKNKAE